MSKINKNDKEVMNNDNNSDVIIKDLLDNIIVQVDRQNTVGEQCSSNNNNTTTTAITITTPNNNHQDSMVEIYRMENRNYISSQSDFSLIVPSRKPTKSSNLPPSYSSVLKMGPATPEYCRFVRSAEGPQFGPNIRATRSAIEQNPFVHRVAPPSYAEIHGGDWSATELSHHSSEELVLGPDPTLLWCSRCRTVVITSIQCQRTKFTHFVAATLCVFGCWPCCLIPYCSNTCKTIHHTCPYCNYVFGSYTPW